MNKELSGIFLSNTENKNKVHTLMKSGKLRKLSSKLYTSNLTDDANKIVSRNLWKIVDL